MSAQDRQESPDQVLLLLLLLRQGCHVLTLVCSLWRHKHAACSCCVLAVLQHKDNIYISAEPACPACRLMYVNEAQVCKCRVHLSSLGFPIANDTQYGGQYKGPIQVRTHAAVKKREAAEQSSAPDQGASDMYSKAADSKRQRCSDSQPESQASISSPPDGQQPHTGWATADTKADPDRNRNAKQAAFQEQQQLLADPDLADFQVPPDLQDDMCLNCPNLIPPGYPTDIIPLWLHARSYSCEQWSFKCPDPAWASTTWQTDV